jgi:hypothetical protein
MPLRQESVCTNNQVVLRVAWDWQSGPGEGRVTMGDIRRKHHLQHVGPGNGEEDAFQFVKSVGTFSQNVKA